MPQSENSDENSLLLNTAEEILTRRFGSSLRLHAEQIQDGSERSHVLRCRVTEAGGSAPESVIIKRVRDSAEHPYDPDSAEPMGPSSRLFNDWAGAEFLSRVPGDPPNSPLFYGGDRAVGLIVMEDIGEGESLADLLLGKDALRAEQSLLAFAAAMGRMHAATVGRVEEYARLRVGLGPANPTARTNLADSARNGFQCFQETAATLKITVPSGAEAEVETVAAAMLEPGPFLAYTHGDPCPDNNRMVGANLRLFDFEFGGFRHALLDGVYGRVPFPTCWCVNRLPSHLPLKMETIYREELEKGCPQAAEDRLFYPAVVAACAHWMLITLAWHLTPSQEKDSEWGISTTRQRILMRLDCFAATASEFQSLPALAEAACLLAKALRAVWPPEADAMPLYPAFRPEASKA